MAAVIILLNTSGCAILGRRGQSAEVLSTARELSRQGITALEAGQPQEAEELLKKSLAASPDDPTAHRYMAEALWRRGASGEALSQIAEAVRLDPTNAAVAVRAGEMSLASGRRDQAAAYAEQAIRLDPKLASAWALRGRCFMQMKQSGRALADLQRAADLAPNDPDLLWQVASIYRQRGENERCLTALYHLLDSYSPGEEPQSVLVMQGQTLMDLGRPLQASDAFLAAIQHGPPSADLCYYLAQSYSAAGRTADATAAAQRALAINSTHAPSQQLLAQLASRTATAAPQRR
ncbi:MAG TPA: tetratricopeptide repeat protein [Lacipirellulaceae bacterium]|nr:tetratricopeptide repeat protein [Lacipirellulaceae bacterium]